MNSKQIVAVLIAVGCVAGSALAQQEATAPELVHAKGDFVKQGNVEYGFNGAYSAYEIKSFGTDYDLNILRASGEINYFVMDRLSLGLGANFIYAFGNVKNGPQFDEVLINPEVTARYHFRLNTHAPIYPYVGLGIGTAYGWENHQTGPDGSSHSSMDMTLMSYSGQVGFKVPLEENVYFDTCLKYTDYNRIFPAGYNLDLSGWQLLVGLKINM